MPITQAAPRVLLCFLLDRSASMAEPPQGPWATKADLAAAALNECLGQMIDQASASGLEEAVDVEVLGYHTDRLARPITGSLLPVGPAPTLGQLGRSPSRTEARVREVLDEYSGDIVEESYEVPLWIGPEASGGTPMVGAMRACWNALELWAKRNPLGAPPVVVHVTDGRSRDGDPADVGADRRPAVLITCRLATRGAPFMGGDSLEETLARMSSPWPLAFLRTAAAESPQLRLEPGSRAMIYSADAGALRDVLDLVTRVALAPGESASGPSGWETSAR